MIIMNVTLFTVDTAKPFSQYEHLLKFTSAERALKIQKYKFDKDKILSLFSHLLSKSEIATALNIPFSDVEFMYNEYGKPYISQENFHFSVSHSGNLVAFAIHSSPVGIDVQKTEDKLSCAMKFFTENEQKYIGDCPEKFFEVWTKKEAYVKMLGTGISKNFKSYDVLDKDIKNMFFSKNIHGYFLSVCAEDIIKTNINIRMIKQNNEV